MFELTDGVMLTLVNVLLPNVKVAEMDRGDSGSDTSCSGFKRCMSIQ